MHPRDGFTIESGTQQVLSERLVLGLTLIPLEPPNGPLKSSESQAPFRVFCTTLLWIGWGSMSFLPFYNSWRVTEAAADSWDQQPSKV